MNGATRQVEDFETVEKEVTAQEIDRDAMFGNFKVNRHTFNFFLKNLQFDPTYKNVKSRQIYNSNQAGDMQKLFLIIEKGVGEWWGRIEGKGNFMPVIVANSIGEVIGNMKLLIRDYLQPERKDKF